MRILHVASEHPPLQVFGLGRYVCDLSRALAQKGHSVHVLTNSIGGQDQDVVDHGVYIHRVDSPPPPKPPSQGAPVLAFNLHLQQRAEVLGRKGLGNPEVVVSHDWLTVLAGHRLARRLGLPHVWTVHDTVHGKRAGKIEEVEDRVAFDLEMWGAKSADLVLVNSRAIGDEVAEVFRGERARMGLLHPGLDPERFTWPQSVRRVEAFRSVLAARDELLITYCGRLDLEKGIDTLLNAIPILCRKVPKLRVALAGRGVLQPMIADHIRQLGLESVVQLHGYLEGKVLEQFYRVSDLHVCPSHYEPFGLVALEAMAAGAPVVVSATGGLTDIVSSPEVGRTFPPRDIAALAGVLEELALDPQLRRRIGEAGRRHARATFSWSVLAEEALRQYGRVVAAAERVTA